MELNRTPPAGKPWYRARNLFLAAAAAVLAWIGIDVYRALTAKPSAAINYAQKLEELVHSRQSADAASGGENAWELLGPALEANEAVNAEFRVRTITTAVILDYSTLYIRMAYDVPGYDRTSQEQMRTDAVEAIGMLRDLGAFEAMERAAATPYSYRPGPSAGPLIRIMLPDLGRIRNLARANAARMYLATGAGEGRELARAYEDTLGLARILTQQAFLIEHLTGYAAAAHANAELARDLIERRWDEATLRACLGALDRQRSLMGGIDLAIQAERYSVLDTIQWTHTDDGHGSGRLILTSIPALTGTAFSGGNSWLDKLFEYKIGNLAGVAYPSKRAVVRRANDYFDKVLAYSRASSEARKVLGFHPDIAVVEMPSRYIILRLMLPAMGAFVRAGEQHEISMDGTRLVLAVEIYRATHGRYPNSLKELTPEVLPELPMDPFGQSFGYRTFAPGEDEGGRGFTVYSLGADLTDNGGAFNAKNPLGAMNPANAGLDIVINLPREKQPEETKPDAPAAPGAERP